MIANEEVYASHGSASDAPTVPSTNNVNVKDSTSIQRTASVARVTEFLAENVWDAITNDVSERSRSTKTEVDSLYWTVLRAVAHEQFQSSEFIGA